MEVVPPTLELLRTDDELGLDEELSSLLLELGGLLLELGKRLLELGIIELLDGGLLLELGIIELLDGSLLLELGLLPPIVKRFLLTVAEPWLFREAPV